MSQVFADKNVKLLAENGFTLNEEAVSYSPIYNCQRWSIGGEIFSDVCYLYTPDGDKTFNNFEELFAYLEEEIFEYTSMNPKYDKPAKYPRY